MSDVSKSLFIAAMIFTSMSRELLYSQEPVPVQNCPNPSGNKSNSTEPTIIFGEPSADPASVGPQAEPEDDAYAESVKIFSLTNCNAEDARRIIGSLFGFPDVKIATDDRSNSVIISSDKGSLSEIEAVLQRLDELPTAAIGGTSVKESVQRSGDRGDRGVSIADSRQRLDALEQPVQQLVGQVRAAEVKLGKDHLDSVKLRAELRKLVQKTFAARQEIQRAELAEFTRRLQSMQQSIETREKIVEKIVDRRMEELLHPETNWNSASPFPRETSKSKVTSSPLKSGKGNGHLISFLGTWEVKELNIKSAGIDISAVAPKPRLTVTENHFVVPMDGGITVTMKYELVAGDPLRVNLTFDGSNAQTFGIIKYTDDSFWLCFREPADAGEPGLTENNRPIEFLPGEKRYYLKCKRSPSFDQPVAAESKTPMIEETFLSDDSPRKQPSARPSMSADRLRLIQATDVVIKNIEEFKNRTPLKLILEFKDEPLLQITDDFQRAVQELQDHIKVDESDQELREFFASVKKQGSIFVETMGRLRSQAAIFVVREIEEGIKTLETLIESERSPGDSELPKSTPKNSAAIPTFATPESVLAHLDSASTSGDFGVIADCLSEDESRRFAGILLHQSSMISTISLIAARVSNDSSQLAEDASAITAMAIVLKSSMVPDPPADAKAAYDKLTASFVNIFASQPASFDPDEFLQLLIKSTGILKDHRAFIRDMGKAMSEIDDKAKNAESPFGAAKPQWNVVIDGIDGDHATATDLRERKPGANLLTPATTEIQLDRIDGDWKISKLFGDEIIKQLAAGPQVSPSETDSSK